MSYGSTPPPPPPPPPPGSGFPPPPDSGMPGDSGASAAGAPQSPWGAPAEPVPAPPPAAPQGHPAAPPLAAPQGHPAAPGYPPPAAGYPQTMPPAGPYAPYAASPVGELATWPQRALGYIIDGLVALPASVLIFIGQPKTTTITVNGRTTTSTDGGSIGLLLLGVVLALGIAYWNRWMKGGQGQTIGRKVAGVKLVNAQGQPVGTTMAFVRDLAHFVDGAICWIGYLFPLWDAKRQTLADKIVNTYVVTVPK